MFQNSVAVLFTIFSSSSFFLANSRRKGFQPVKSPSFCVGQQEKKNRLKRTSKKNRYFGICKPAICFRAPVVRIKSAQERSWIEKMISKNYEFNEVRLKKH